jgi:alkaline phosphatase
VRARNAIPLALLVLLSAGLAMAQDDGAPRPRNVILMIADGCGFNHLRAASLWRDDADLFPSWQDLPVKLAVSTFSDGNGYDAAAFWANGPLGQPATDSAAAVTALSTGHKTHNGWLGVGPDGKPLLTIVEAMELGGRATGLVTSVPFAHATPAGCAIHNEDRGRYVEIAIDLLTATPLDVLMGCGHPLFDRKGDPDASPNYRWVGGEDTWNGLLAGAVGGDANGDAWPDPWTLIQDPADFAKLVHGDTPARVLGLARVRETLQEQRAGDVVAAPFAVPPLATVPALKDMALGAINVLDGDPDGFFLMIEGGAVDWASHDGEPGRLVEEVCAFADAVTAVRGWVEAHGGWQENLLVITADHETGYLTGPAPLDGVWPACRLKVPLDPRGKGRLPGMVLNGNSHTNSLVPLFAAGPGSEALAARAVGRDPVRGPYLDNTDIGSVLQEMAVRR